MEDFFCWNLFIVRNTCLNLNQNDYMFCQYLDTPIGTLEKKLISHQKLIKYLLNYNLMNLLILINFCQSLRLSGIAFGARD